MTTIRRGSPRAGSAVLAATLSLLVAGPALAQVQSVGASAPVGLPIPLAGVAAAEEATALAVNPAGPGFVGAPSLHYLHLGDADGRGAHADGLWTAGLLGPFGPSLSVEWVRPETGAGPRYRLTTLGLALSDGRVASLGVAWRRWSSPDAALEALAAWDVGFTLRPGRHLSLALSAEGLDARLGGLRLPVRYDAGLATRLLSDGLTVAVDLLGDDRSRNDVHLTHAAAGLQLELLDGLGISAQVRVPLRQDTSRGVATVLALAWNTAHAGWTGGATTRPGRTDWLAGARLSAEQYRAAPAADSAARLDLAGLLEPHRVLFLELGERDPYGALLRRLEAARQDPAVAAVLLQVDELPLGGGRIEELRAAITRLSVRKPVLAWLTGGGTRSYWLASAASAIAAPPSSALLVNGLARSQLYLKEGLARLGVAFEVARAGAYKSAPEPLTRTGPSPESRQMTESLLDDVSTRLVSDVAAARRLPVERVRALLDQGIFTAAEAVAAGLIDEPLWPDELDGWVRRTVRRPLRLEAGWRPAPARAAQRWGAPPALAVVRVEGTIAGGQSRRDPLGGAGLAGAETISAALRQAARDGRVKAIVLRIESPGGDAVASDLIWREVVQARRQKPVVVSMGDLAASGGYLVAMGGDVVIAEPATLTGSIGVFALKPDLAGLLDRLSLHRDTSQRGALADVASPWKPWTPGERAAVEHAIDAVYATFLDRVVEGRKLPRAEVEAVAGGRVWTGAQALERKLVDRLGGLAEALTEARQRAHLAPDEEVELVDTDGGRARWLPAPLAEAATALLPEAHPEPLEKALAALPELRTAAQLVELGPILMLPMDWLPPPP